MSRRQAIGGIIAVVMIAGGRWAWRAALPRPPQTRVAVASAACGEFVVSLLAEGTLQSDDAVTVRTGKAPGELTMIVPDGMVVRVGDVFCRIEARELQRRQDDAKLAYEQAQEGIETARDNAEERYDNDQRSLEQSEKDYHAWEESVTIRTKQAEAQLTFDEAEAQRLRVEWERTQRLSDKGYTAGSEAEIARAAFDAQQFKVEQSKKDLELSRRQIATERSQRQTQLAAARRRTEISQGRIAEMVNHAESRAEVAARELETVVAALAETTILAPASGTVSLNSTFRGGERRSWREGDQVSSGTPLGSVSGSENMSVRCRVKESQIAALRKGQEAEVEFEALGGRTFAGVVSSVGAVAREVWIWEDPTAEANARVFDVLVKVKQTPAQGLKPGLNARARITLQRLQNKVYVPLEAVFARGEKSLVYVKEKDEFVAREVQLGERSEVAVVVRKGLAEGEVVALTDPTRAPAAKARKGR